ncbi:MAG: ABC transporter ATP-binding protein [Chloroflexi bacterium]|nr:ABC transporter ATP-binding protein [Chloroflexota bacterium]
MSAASLIELRDVSKYYDGNVAALDHVNFEVAKGEWVSIMGPSGSGKTTLLNILSCLDRPTSGSITVAGMDLAEMTAAELVRFRRETIGLIFQQFHLIPYLSALENVMLAQYFHSMADEAEAADALRRVGLEDRLRHLPSQLSGGEQQRVCIARALINQPRLILADEPTGNLDHENEERVMSILNDLHREGNTLVMVTHDQEIGEMAQRIVRLKHGRVV